MDVLKKMAIAVVGAVASFYATKVVTEMLEKKPLKARVRDGKQKVVDIANTAVEKATDFKNAAVDKAAEVKTAAAEKAKTLIDGVEDLDKKDGL